MPSDPGTGASPPYLLNGAQPMTEVPGLPATGPVTLPAVKAELGYTDVVAARDARLQLRVDAVNAFVRDLPIAADAVTYAVPPPAPQWPPYITLGGTMLCARLWRRKDSPEGVTAFADQGAVYVSRNDPDVAQLLHVGNYRPPLVG